MDISERIKRRREELGMTQGELARAVGYKGRSSINKIEVNAQHLPQQKIYDIARALKTTPSYIMGWEDEDIANLTARQEETLRKFYCLTEDNQILIDKFIDSLLEQQKG